ncbi:MAG: divalent-cation tolerance protein CutA [Rhodospirillales bacterium]|nr:divalent-cation tolerance protein CutA [Rhodospirillales bacterium]
MGYRLLYITASSMDEAEMMGKGLVSARLAACANILCPIKSFYWWQGKMEEGSEVALIAKTTAELVEAATDWVKSHHSYTVPCVVSVPIDGGNADFLRWIWEETQNN